ncbi:Na+/H+ antiporter NhaA [Moraxella osloensis]|uniref:Na(+)/H(+) antiporter NhaA n=1 Tax=Faucicola osloensis TaxID=34062 RepID=A0A6P1KKG1_FAUOS|nr:Na+/H+ antiporter NhaA [Moraxella osloensis]QHG08845.1 Na+/H+ antiporter NhaA [Moraxella osloensis]
MIVFNQFKKFLAHDMAAGIVLAFAAVLAMLVANSPLSDIYEHFLHLPISIKIGSFSINHYLLHWINDGLMVVFFFLVGLELKREMLVGELSEVKKVVLPAIAAVGGMMVPAIFYAAFNYQHADLMKGWAIPAATDIAFALGVLTLLGNRVPAALKVFLASIAIFDDIGAIIIIALFYSSGLSMAALTWVGVCLVILWLMNRFNVTRTTAYIMIGVLLWAAMLKSGIHATLAGVLLALFIPMTDNKHPEHSPLESVEHDLQDTVSFIILPIFAFANAGIYLGGTGLSSLLHTVPLGIALGLLLGKPIGVMLFSWLGVKLGLASLPTNVDWRQVFGVAILCGIGFTMSLFIGGLAFAGLEVKPFDERIGIILGSLLAGILGYFYLKKVLPTHALTQPVTNPEDHTYIR